MLKSLPGVSGASVCRQVAWPFAVAVIEQPGTMPSVNGDSRSLAMVALTFTHAASVRSPLKSPRQLELVSAHRPRRAVMRGVFAANEVSFPLASKARSPLVLRTVVIACAAVIEPSEPDQYCS